MTWPLPELAVGVEFGEFRPLDAAEPLEVPEPLPACCVLLAAELPDVAAPVVPGRVAATAPAAMTLAAAAEAVTARSRALPRSRAAVPFARPRGGLPCGSLYCWRWLMTASLAAGFRLLL